MKYSDKPSPSHIVIIKRKPCYKHEDCIESDMAIAWVLRKGIDAPSAKERVLDTLEDLGWREGLMRKV